MFSKRQKQYDDASKIIKLTPAEKRANELPIKIILAIKTTGFHNYNPEAGDDIIEVAAIETLDGKPTGERFHAFIRIENADLLKRELKHCSEKLGAMKKTNEAEALCANMANAQPFHAVQPALLAFLQRNIECTILVHNIKHVLNFLRHKMDKAGNEQLAQMQNSMIDMISKAAELSHLGLYKGGLFPSSIQSNRETYKQGRTFYKFADLCDGFNVKLTNYSGFSALRSAELLVDVDRNMQLLKERQTEADAEMLAAAPTQQKRMRK